MSTWLVLSLLVAMPAAALDQSRGGYELRAASLVAGSSVSTAGPYALHASIGQPVAGFQEGDNYEVQLGDSPDVPVPPPLLPPLEVAAGPRFVSLIVSPVGAGMETALRVELTSLHHPMSPPPGTPDFAAFEGAFRYVNSFGGTITCVDSATLATDYRCGRLGCEPEYRDWAADLAMMTNPASPPGLIHVTGDAVVPSSTLGANQIAAVCGTASTADNCALISAQLAISTSHWGDVGSGGGGLPDGIANVIDIGTVVDKVKGLPSALPAYRTWLKSPASPQAGSVNVIDIGLVVDSVKGLPYPYTISVCP